VAGIDEIKFWILKWGAKARVLEPQSLRELMRAEAEAMVANYLNPEADKPSMTQR
jgi:predicted DNA-binding transcriptional regulator YafY